MESIQLFGGKRRRAVAEVASPSLPTPVAQPQQSFKADNGDIIADFSGLGIAPWLQMACSSMGIRKPTPVQAACIPPALAGRHVVGCALTGSGKTAAFALPILHALAAE